MKEEITTVFCLCDELHKAMGIILFQTLFRKMRK